MAHILEPNHILLLSVIVDLEWEKFQLPKNRAFPPRSPLSPCIYLAQTQSVSQWGKKASHHPFYIDWNAISIKPSQPRNRYFIQINSLARSFFPCSVIVVPWSPPMYAADDRLLWDWVTLIFYYNYFINWIITLASTYSASHAEPVDLLS